jgi:hypothetical protein
MCALRGGQGRINWIAIDMLNQAWFVSEAASRPRQTGSKRGCPRDQLAIYILFADAPEGDG